MMNTYHNPLSADLADLRRVARVGLSNLKLSPELITQVDEAAKASGEAIFEFLKTNT